MIQEEHHRAECLKATTGKCVQQSKRTREMAQKYRVRIQFDEDVDKVLDMKLAGSLDNKFRTMVTTIYSMGVDTIGIQVHIARKKVHGWEQRLVRLGETRIPMKTTQADIRRTKSWITTATRTT